MDANVVVDGEASETESEYSDSEEEFSEAIENSNIPDPATVPAATNNQEIPADSSPVAMTTDTVSPAVVPDAEVNSSTSSVPPPPSPSLTLFEENLRERNAVFSNQITGLVNGYFDRVVKRIRFLNTDCKALQANLERVTSDCHSTKSNLTRGLNQLEDVLLFRLLPEQ